MPRHRKRFIHRSVYDLTYRIEEGLPFVAKPYMQLILESYLAEPLWCFDRKAAVGILKPSHAWKITGNQADQ